MQISKLTGGDLGLNAIQTIFKQKKVLLGAFPVIVKSSRASVSSSLPGRLQLALRLLALGGKQRRGGHLPQQECSLARLEAAQLDYY